LTSAKFGEDSLTHVDVTSYAIFTCWKGVSPRRDEPLDRYSQNLAGRREAKVNCRKRRCKFRDLGRTPKIASCPNLHLLCDGMRWLFVCRFVCLFVSYRLIWLAILCQISRRSVQMWALWPETAKFKSNQPNSFVRARYPWNNQNFSSHSGHTNVRLRPTKSIWWTKLGSNEKKLGWRKFGHTLFSYNVWWRRSTYNDVKFDAVCFTQCVRVRPTSGRRVSKSVTVSQFLLNDP